MTRFTATGTLEGRISSNGHITGFGQLLGIQAGDLFLDAAIGMGDNDSGIGFRRVIILRRVDVGRNRPAIEVIVDRVDIDLSFSLCVMALA